MLVLFLGYAAPSLGQSAVPEKSVTIVRVDDVPVIDGVLDDAIWEQAALVDDIHQVRPNEYSEPSQKTEFLLAYDDEYLYVGARLFEEDPSLIGAKILRQGEGLRVDDRIRIILDPFLDKRSGFQFQMNANGVRHDGIYVGTEQDFNWDGIWFGDAKVTAEGWTTEVAIPFKTLSFNPDSDWGLNLARQIVRNNEIIGWSSRNREFDPAVSGVLKGIRGVSQGMGLDIVPAFSTLRLNDRVADRTETNYEPSVDIYYKLTSALNGALTFNTDFSATEVDNRQVDLSRFSQFFPEKRSFFLRESDIFEFGGIGGESNDSTVSRPDRENARPFFSRRVGLSASGAPVGLDAGARITGRIGNWNVGALGIIQEEFEGVDSTNIFVGRAAFNVLSESSLGFIATSGDPRSNKDNSLFGLDFRYLNTHIAGGRRLEGNVWFQQTDTGRLSENEYDLLSAEEQAAEDARPVGEDYAYGLSLNYPSEDGIKAGLSAREVREDFNPALGFVSRRDVRQYWGDVGYTYRFEDSYLNSVFFGVDSNTSRLIDGGLQSENILLRLFETETNVGDELTLRYNIQKESIRGEPFEVSDGVEIPIGSYRFSETELAIETSRARAADVELSVAVGEFYTGDINSYEALLNWRPSMHFATSLSYGVDFVDLPEGEFDQRVVSTTIATTFTNRLSWVNLIQYDNESNKLGIDSRLHWAPELGRNLFFVVSQGFDRDEIRDRYTSEQTDITLKVDYTFRF